MLNELKTVIAKDVLNDSNNRQHKQRIVSLINRNIHDDSDWEIFEKNFAEVHEDFLEKLKEKYPDITAGELKLAAYIKMNLSSKEIAPLLNISVRSVENKRYRLRKKMGIAHDSNLSDHLLRL
jgi:DNA-binding CsgD family transcriptional regulator